MVSGVGLGEGACWDRFTTSLFLLFLAVQITPKAFSLTPPMASSDPVKEAFSEMLSDVSDPPNQGGSTPYVDVQGSSSLSPSGSNDIPKPVFYLDKQQPDSRDSTPPVSDPILKFFPVQFPQKTLPYSQISTWSRQKRDSASQGRY